MTRPAKQKCKTCGYWSANDWRAKSGVCENRQSEHYTTMVWPNEACTYWTSPNGIPDPDEIAARRAEDRAMAKQHEDGQP